MYRVATTSKAHATTFRQVAALFNALNEDERHFVNSNDICTPMECVKEMVDAVPSEFWGRKNIKVLDSCCGNGNFHAYIAHKTDLSNLYFNEINQKRVANLINYFGADVNLTQRDFLTFDDAPQYDMVVSNPPYAKFNGGLRVSKNHNLARAFIDKALRITKPNGFVLFIVPNNWMSYSDRNTLPKQMSKYQFLRLDIHGAKKWFPKVGSSFTWFLLQKRPNTEPFRVSNNYILQNESWVSLDAGADFIPLYYDELVKSIFAKVVYAHSEKYALQTSSFLHHHTKKALLSATPTAEHRYRLIHTPTQTVYSKIPHKYQSEYKVFLSLTNQYATFVDNCGMTQSVAFIRCASRSQAIRIKNELDSGVYKFINNLTRYGNFNNVRILQRLSVLGSFTLTDQEQQLITRVNEAYYGKK